MSSSTSKQHQSALLGHCMVSDQIWSDVQAHSVDVNWFEGQQNKELFSAIASFRARHNRHPTEVELYAHIEEQDPPAAKDRLAHANYCLGLSLGIGIDVLMAKISQWEKGRIIATKGAQLSKDFNAGNHEAAFKTWEDAAQELRRIDQKIGQKPDSMETSAVRVKSEQAGRLKDASKQLSYGIPFLDDALIGIIPNDLILVGATTGAGKTELAKIIARHNAQLGRRVSFFALEAEENEIERRIKFSMLVERWTNDNFITKELFGYAEWRLGKHPDLDAYSESVDEEFAKKYSTLNTYYRVRSDFDIEDLDREVTRVHKDSDLIIIDHLHYIDLEGKNENQDMSKLVKKLRHLALGLGVPIICVAHLRKGAGKTLVPDIDDFMGSSDIVKVATACVMLSRCEFISSESEGSATFLKIAKFRLDGDRVGNVGLGFYVKKTGTYTDRYGLGKVNSSGTKWVPTKNLPGWVNQDRILKQQTDIE